MTDFAQADIEPVDLPGEPPTDRAFRCVADGRCYRVRAVKVGEPRPWSDETVVGFIDALEITVVRLGDDRLPERNAAGQVVVLANTRWTIDARTMADARPLDEQLLMQVRNVIHGASRTAAAPIAIDALLAGWAAPGADAGD